MEIDPFDPDYIAAEKEIAELLGEEYIEPKQPEDPQKILHLSSMPSYFSRSQYEQDRAGLNPYLNKLKIIISQI